ncbi:PREDICTED: trypsin-4-like [Nicrophorus vespilloides]|uniref:Trypsin-4-like n=1 Tax=Nicrophorus vespilloides TaxID=110193 RepID=A0ABM1MH29_NICVS|nr:PREDICTED: trypsin-4-like [Nicrophorus vespilloides]
MMKFVVLALAVSVAFATRHIFPRIEQYPYHVSVMRFGRIICGGSIISSKYIITAAHCTVGFSPYTFTIRAGSSDHMTGGIMIYVKKNFSHPEFQPNSRDYDISVLELASPLPFGSRIKKLALPMKGEAPIVGANVVITGWGYTDAYSSIPRHLQAVIFEVISMEECRNRHRYIEITDRMFCARVDDKEGRNVCKVR